MLVALLDFSLNRSYYMNSRDPVKISQCATATRCFRRPDLVSEAQKTEVRAVHSPNGEQSRLHLVRMDWDSKDNSAHW